MLLRKSVLILGMVIFTTGLFAQTLADAGEKYNAANEQYKARAYGSSVKLYEEALKMCKDLGGSAADLQMNVEKQLTNAYYYNGKSLYKKRAFDASIAQFKEAKKLAAVSGNDKIKRNSVIYIAGVITAKGNSLLKQKKADAALAEYDKALAVKANYLSAYLGKANAYKEKGDMNQMMAYVDKVITMGGTGRIGIKKATQAKKLAYLTLLSNGASELQKEHASKALTYLTNAQKYGEASADLDYYTAIANLKLNKWDAAIAAAKKAIALKKNDASDIYFTLGQAYQGKGDATNACNTFKKVTKGPNVAAAKYQMKEVLKCK